MKYVKIVYIFKILLLKNEFNKYLFLDYMNKIK